MEDSYGLMSEARLIKTRQVSTESSVSGRLRSVNTRHKEIYLLQTWQSVNLHVTCFSPQLHSINVPLTT